MKDVHWLARLGVRFEESLKVGLVVRHNSESSLVVDVKSKQRLDPLLMELEESILRKNIESFSQGEDRVLCYQQILYVLDVDGSREKIMDDADCSRYFIY